MTFGEQVVDFFNTLRFDQPLPDGVEAMNPYLLPETMDAVRKYYTKYYSDSNPRTFIVGINPGRNGAGKTGIAFTDTVRLENPCQIEHNLKPTTELSSEYIYAVVDAMGGPEAFFSKFYLTSASPIGFTHNGKNYNYYDSPAMLKATLSYMMEHLERQLAFGANRKQAICLGAGKNFKYLTEVNNLLGKPFEQIVAVNHPRFVMQYRRKSMEQEIDTFTNALANAL
ncbi:uracil-DNA glycosylase family protein [uncultured Acetobacteroides sp.]|uniref:uracil-DNA glycosylase family protein n=1 Tax=uncultured Acetobacteroides sp. TaxID=1760811 RepID=UPI0029F5B5F4|nr:uracil-DNA glycosylase family protein [uncultured Acetobacteroides sp.]